MRSPVPAEQYTHSLGTPGPRIDWRRQLYFPLRGTVLAVYALDDPKNHAHATFCDIQLWDGYPVLHKVWIGRSDFHQETKEPGPPGQRYRNPYPPRAENGTTGWYASPMPGDMVVVQFIGGDFHQPFIAGAWPASNQGREHEDHPHGGGYPFNQQSRYRVTDGELVEEVTKRLDATRKQLPQWTWMYNGAFIEILNDGSLLLQSSASKTPFIPRARDDLGLDASPTPTGDFVASTRGAQQGDLVLTTGKSDKLGTTPAHGNVLVLLYDAAQGNVILNAGQSGEGNIIGQASRGSDSQIFLRAKNDDDYLHIRGGLSELSAAAQAALRAAKVSLGSRGADRHAVTYEELDITLTAFITAYDAHIHGGVESGSDYTLPPSIGFLSMYQMLYQQLYKSLVVFLELTHASDGAKTPAVDIARGLP